MPGPASRVYRVKIEAGGVACVVSIPCCPGVEFPRRLFLTATVLQPNFVESNIDPFVIPVDWDDVNGWWQFDRTDTTDIVWITTGGSYNPYHFYRVNAARVIPCTGVPTNFQVGIGMQDLAEPSTYPIPWGPGNYPPSAGHGIFQWFDLPISGDAVVPSPPLPEDYDVCDRSDPIAINYYFNRVGLYADLLLSEDSP